MLKNRDMANTSAFGANMVRLREGLGWNRSEFLRQLERAGFDFHLTTMRRLEAGEQEPKLQEALQIAEVLGVNVETLMLNSVQAPLQAEVSQKTALYKTAIVDAVGALNRWHEALEELEAVIKKAKMEGISTRELFDAIDLASRYPSADIFVESWGTELMNKFGR